MVALKRYFYKNYGGEIVHQFKALSGSLELIIHEAFYDIGKAYRPISEIAVRYWYAKQGRKKTVEGYDGESLNRYLMESNVKLLDEAGVEVCF